MVYVHVCQWCIGTTGTNLVPFGTMVVCIRAVRARTDTMVPWNHVVPWYHGTRVRTRVHDQFLSVFLSFFRVYSSFFLSFFPIALMHPLTALQCGRLCSRRAGGCGRRGAAVLAVQHLAMFSGVGERRSRTLSVERELVSSYTFVFLRRNWNEGKGGEHTVDSTLTNSP
jgi:hypothetical protein